MTTSKSAARTPRDSAAKAKALRSEPSVPEHVPDIEGQGGASAAALSHEERVRRRAFELYLARAGAPGSEHQDWSEAEAQIAAEQS
ncbi:hypothetical protein BH11PSE9_BH11PSE9_32930 [soil metagenome]